MKKMGRRPEQTFFQRHMDGQQVHEKMLTITNHQRNAIQNHHEMSPHTFQNGYYQRQQITSIVKDAEKGEPSCMAGGNIKWCSLYRKQYGDSSKNSKQNDHTMQQFHSWVFIQRKQTHSKRHMHPYVHCSIAYNSQDMETT